MGEDDQPRNVLSAYQSETIIASTSGAPSAFVADRKQLENFAEG